MFRPSTRKPPAGRSHLVGDSAFRESNFAALKLYATWTSDSEMKPRARRHRTCCGFIAVFFTAVCQRATNWPSSCSFGYLDSLRSRKLFVASDDPLNIL